MLVGAADHHRACVIAAAVALVLTSGELQHLVVVEVLLEVLAVGEEVEELEGGLLWL